ncbi:MAG: hypothetical protein HFH08_01605 [Bacilli bacterium]|nr:hypothetical protein [Bacilli bacterium]
MQENRNPLKEAIGKSIKKKIFMFIAPALPGIFLFFLVAAVAAIILYPILKGGQLVAGVAGFWDRLTNTITLKCLFCSDEDLAVKKEEKFYKKVDKINETYLSGKNMEGTSIQLDIPLLLSTVFYTEDIEDTIFSDADTTDSSEEGENMDDVSSGDLLGDLSWYYDQSDQKSIDWFLGETEEEGCYIKGYYYYDHEQFTLGKKSKLRKIAKHMVKRKMEGVCWAVYDEETGEFLYHDKNDWAVYVLDISRDDSLYTMEFDQQPYKTYRTASEVANLPPAFITYLISTYLPEQFNKVLPKAVKDLSEDHKLYLEKRKVMKNVIYSYKSGYEYLIGNRYDYGAICGEINGNCSYTVKSIDNKTVNVSNLKVRLLQCGDGNRGEPIPGEELIDFEKYITGVTYAENGGAPMEAMKAEAIAARSYSLMRGQTMGTSYLKIYKENGQWILPIRNCTEDQVYCDPDKGCTMYGEGKTVRSGQHSGGTYKPALSADSNVRKAVAETTGKVLSDASGNIISTPYTSTTHKQWNEAAKNGSDAYQILAETYGTNNVIKASCSGAVGTTTNSGSGKYYNQGDYAHVPYCSGGSTVSSAGCLPTAYAMVVENLTGKVTTPQAIAEYICNDVNGSRKYRDDGGTSSRFVIDQATQSHFMVSARDIPVNERNIDNIIKILQSGKMIMASVKGTGTFATENGHYIILSSVTPDGKIKVLDPGHRSATKDHSTSVIQTEVLNKLNYTMIEFTGSRNGGSTSDGCYTGATGDYVAWRQGDKTWKDVVILPGGCKNNLGQTVDCTIGRIGCLATSVAKLIAMSGTQVTISSFNPGTMVKYLLTRGGFSGANWVWNGPQTSGLTPNFVHGGSVSLRGKTEREKITTVKNYLDQGYYLVLQVKCEGTEEPGQHWVAVLGVTDTDIVMSDPASSKTTVWSEYKSGGTVQFHYYKKTD